MHPYPRPPPSPPAAAATTYTPFYCEENVHLLLPHLSPPSYALFITNPTRSSLLFQQRASKAGEEQAHHVVWDYHVVAISLEEDGRAWVWDRDSRLGMPCELGGYLQQTFRPDLFALGILPPSLASQFRLVPSSTFLSNFASDRSHMLSPPRQPQESEEKDIEASAYIHPPPPYPPLQGPLAQTRGEVMNLFEGFLDLDLGGSVVSGEEGREQKEARYGVLLRSTEELMSWFGAELES